MDGNGVYPLQFLKVAIEFVEFHYTIVVLNNFISTKNRLWCNRNVRVARAPDTHSFYELNVSKCLARLFSIINFHFISSKIAALIEYTVICNSIGYEVEFEAMPYHTIFVKHIKLIRV